MLLISSPNSSGRSSWPRANCFSVGLSGSWARRIIRLGLGEGLLDSPSEKGPLSIVFSSKTLESYFPKLYQDLPVEGE
jgi:hypothetical protein